MASMELAVSAWQLIAVATSAFVVWSSMLVAAVMWLDRKFSELVPGEVYERRHNQIDNRLWRLELWAAQQGFMQNDKKE